MSKAQTLETLTLKPSDLVEAIKGMRKAGTAMFVWGPPGIAKSAVSAQVADDLGVAFVDIRLSQMDPTDLRGIPFPIVENDVHGVKWSAPLALPRDLNFKKIMTTAFADTVELNFANLNPEGSNGIRVVTKPQIFVTSVGGGPGEARIIEQSACHAVAAVFVGDEMVPGSIRFTVTGKAQAIVGFEEFNSAPPSVMAASYQLILDRRLGEYVVPDGCYLMAMGNRETDKGVTFRMAPPIVNRFVHVEMVADFNDWQVWALQNGVHPEVVGYLSFRKEELFNFNPGSAARGFQTPRSWTFVSKIITTNDYLSDQVEFALIVGAVGDAAGAEFNAFRKIAKDLPHADDILSGRLTKLGKPCEVHLAYALTTSMCYELQQRHKNILREFGEGWKDSPARKNWLKEADRFLEFMMVNFDGKGGNAGAEICVLGARTAIRIHKLPFDTRVMKHFDSFAQRFKEVIVS